MQLQMDLKICTLGFPIHGYLILFVHILLHFEVRFYYIVRIKNIFVFLK